MRGGLRNSIGLREGGAGGEEEVGVKASSVSPNLDIS